MKTEQEIAKKVRMATLLNQIAQVTKAIVVHPNTVKKLEEVQEEKKSG
jgi:hypothetical protein